MRTAAFFISLATSLLGADVERVGTIAHPEIKECSGIVASRQYPNVFWVHNDGKKERLYAINRKGATLAEFKIEGAKFQDWEDIALDAENNLYAADTGNNDGKRAEVAVYQFAEPNPSTAGKSVAIKRDWVVRYPGEPRDCESIVVVGGNAYLVSKVSKNRLAEVFTFPLQDSAAGLPKTTSRSPLVLKPLARLAIDSPVTASALSADGKRFAAISKEGAFLFDFSGEFPASGIMRPQGRVSLRHDSTEACDFVPDGLLVAAESRELFLVKIAPH
jgi:hypothetical protein